MTCDLEYGRQIVIKTWVTSWAKIGKRDDVKDRRSLLVR